MPIWNSLKRELDRAGQAAQDALDEGRLRLEQHRAKQRAEAAAASLGFAIYRARAERTLGRTRRMRCQSGTR